MTAGPSQLVVAVPGLGAYQPDNGIGRVFQSLATHWGDRVRLVGAELETVALPLVRNFPRGVRAPRGTDLVLLPRLTGAQALRRTRGVSGVVVVHDVGVVDFPGDREETGWLTHLAIRRSFWGLRHASAVVAVSHFTRERLLRYLPELEPRVTTIANGVSPVFFDQTGDQAECRRRLGERAGSPLAAPLLVYVGTEIIRKNVPLLLAVLKILRAEHPQAQLLKVGKAGSPRARARTVASARALGLEVGKDLLFLDEADDQTLADAYRAADVFVSASLYEGFCLPALEAMACGTPVVVTNRSALPEVVGDAGRIVEPAAGPFVQAVAAVLAAGKPKALVEKGRARAASFRWSVTANRYLELMREVSARSINATGSAQASLTTEW